MTPLCHCLPYPSELIMQSFVDELLASDPTGGREAARARLRVAVAEALLLRMEELGTSKAHLAEVLCVSRSAVTQALTGNRNMSLNLLADMAAALKMTAHLVLKAEVSVPLQSAQPASKLSVHPLGEQQRIILTVGNANPSIAVLQIQRGASGPLRFASTSTSAGTGAAAHVATGSH